MKIVGQISTRLYPGIEEPGPPLIKIQPSHELLYVTDLRGDLALLLFCRILIVSRLGYLVTTDALTSFFHNPAQGPCPV